MRRRVDHPIDRRCHANVSLRVRAANGQAAEAGSTQGRTHLPSHAMRGEAQRGGEQLTPIGKARATACND